MGDVDDVILSHRKLAIVSYLGKGLAKMSRAIYDRRIGPVLTVSPIIGRLC